jgi:ATP-dependent Zn protease
MVRNSGDLSGSYEVELIIDNQVVQSKEIILDGQTGEVVTFTTSRNAPGLYLVSVNGVPGSFNVIDSVVVNDTEDSPAALTQIKESPSSTAIQKTTGWWLAGTIFVADTLLVIIIVMWLIRRRRKARQVEKEELMISYDPQAQQDRELKD